MTERRHLHLVATDTDHTPNTPEPTPKPRQSLRPDFATAFLGLLGAFNLIAVWIGPAETAVIYGAVATSCFGLLLVRIVARRRLKALGLSNYREGV